MHVLRYCFVYCVVSFVSLRSRRRRRRRGFLKVPSVDGWATLRRKTATFPPFCAYPLFCLSPLTQNLPQVTQLSELVFCQIADSSSRLGGPFWAVQLNKHFCMKLSVILTIRKYFYWAVKVICDCIGFSLLRCFARKKKLLLLSKPIKTIGGW